MQISYRITATEWREAIRVYQSRRGRPIASGAIWMCIVAPLVGAGIEAARTWRPGKPDVHASVGPLLVVLVCVTALVAYGIHRWQQSRTPLARSLPTGEWEMTLSEGGLVRRACDENQPEVEYIWSDFSEMRIGHGVFVLMFADGKGFEVLPQHAFTADQMDWVKRLMARKMRPPRAA